MPARRSTFAIRRVFADGVLLCATLSLAMFAIAANTPPPAVPWPPGNVRLSRLYLARDPLDPAAARNLGLATAASTASVDADQLMAFAATRSRRDTPTENWLLVRRLSEGRYEEALSAADALLRRDIGDQKRERLFALLAAAAHYDASRPALVARLAPAPWWRLPFLRELAERAEPTDTRLVLAGLSKTARPATDVELSPFMDRLVDRQDYRAADRDWRIFSRPRTNPDLVDDSTAPPPFGWSAVAGDGASSALDGRILRVEYDGASNPRMPRRLVALVQGSHRLSWRESIEGDPRMTIKVLCAGSDVALASALPENRGAEQMRFLDFVVPADGCEGQWLTIAAVPAERRSAVDAAFSDWTLTSPRPR